MKKILATALFALLAASCVQDKGNYDYRSADDVFPVKIAGFTYGSDVVPVKQGESLVLDVEKQVTGTEPGRYTYIWFSQQSGSSGAILEREVSRSTDGPNLNLNVSAMAMGSYTMVLEVRDEALNVYRRSNGVRIEISGGYGQGFYVLKNTGTGYANIDYVSTMESDGSGSQDSETGLDIPKQIANAIAGGALPQGEALGLAFAPLYAIDRPKLDADGNPTGAIEYVLYSAGGYAGPPAPPPSLIKKSNMGAFFVATKSNIWTIDPVDMTPIRTQWEQQFFETNALSRNIEKMFSYNTNFAGDIAANVGGSTVYVIIDGKVHSVNFALHSMGSEMGRFSNARIESTGADYHAAPFIPRSNSGCDIIFDELSRSFLWGTSSFTITKWATPVVTGPYGGYAQPNGMPNLSGMPYDLVWMIDNNRQNGAAIAALMKSTSANEYTLLLSTSETTQQINYGILSSSSYYIPNQYPFERKVTVPSGSKLINSVSQFMVHSSSNVYFASENKIYWHLTSGDNVGAEEVLFTLPSDETIAMTKIVRNGTGTCWALTLSNSTSGKWHIRLFKITEGLTPLNNLEIAALNSKPDFHASGDGAAADVTFRGAGYQLFNK